MNLFNAINKYRVSRWFYTHHLKVLAWIMRGLIYLMHNSYIPYTSEIGEGTVLGYKGIGVVVHGNAFIGKNCVIGTNVTIGGGAGGSNKKIEEFDALRRNVPVIGDNVQISTGAKVLGNIVVGSNVIIGANAVVISDIPSNCVVAGVPARIIKQLDPRG